MERPRGHQPLRTVPLSTTSPFGSLRTDRIGVTPRSRVVRNGVLNCSPTVGDTAGGYDAGRSVVQTLQQDRRADDPDSAPAGLLQRVCPGHDAKGRRRGVRRRQRHGRRWRWWGDPEPQYASVSDDASVAGRGTDAGAASPLCGPGEELIIDVHTAFVTPPGAVATHGLGLPERLSGHAWNTLPQACRQCGLDCSFSCSSEQVYIE